VAAATVCRGYASPQGPAFVKRAALPAGASLIGAKTAPIVSYAGMPPNRVKNLIRQLRTGDRDVSVG